MTSTVVTIAEGQIKGLTLENLDGDKFLAFLGIPYAEPPTGERRFKAPVPIEPWQEIKDATKNGNACVQREPLEGTVIGSEDCLNLSVFTKELPSKGSKPKPVMVWIHGGAFLYGSNHTDNYGPDFLLTKDIVLVTINYRLGVLGFLSLKDTSLKVPGNAALKDQLLGLKWVQRNIQVFNGDPKNVTIFGESAGSCAVQYHVLSSSSKGLFHRAIMQSGSALHNWGVPGGVPVTKIAKLLGKDVNTEKEALAILNSASSRQLFDVQEQLVLAAAAGKLQFHPVIEKPNETAFLTKPPLDLVLTGDFNQVPLLLGYNSNEGLYIQISNNLANAGLPKWEPTIDNFLPSKLRESGKSEVVQKIVQRMKDVYLSDENANEKYMVASDAIFNLGMINSAKMHSKISKAPVYLYLMDLDDKLNLYKVIGGVTDLKGMAHADELGYMFANTHLPKPEKGSTAEKSVRTVVQLWTNFALYGSPTPDEKELNVSWKPVSKDVEYLYIGKELLMKSDPQPERVKLWDEIILQIALVDKQ